MSSKCIIGTRKSTGSDRYPTCSFQDGWEIVKDGVVNLVQRLFQEGRLERSLNHTNIALIPKKKNSVINQKTIDLLG